MTVRHVGLASFPDHPVPERVDCPQCDWFGYSADRLAGHLNAVHPLSPALRRFKAAAEAGQGLSTAAARARKGLS